MERYPALTIKQPYATLVARGIKNIENRTWYTSYRGPVYIHAGAAAYQTEPLPVDLWLPAPELFTYGAIIGTATLAHVTQLHPSPWAERGFKHWVFEDAELLDEPVPCRGQMGLWYPESVKPDIHA